MLLSGWSKWRRYVLSIFFRSLLTRALKRDLLPPRLFGAQAIVLPKEMHLAGNGLHPNGRPA